MLQSNRGSASVLFMMVVLPFLLILFVVGIEVSQFLGVRDEVQRILDTEAKLSLGRFYSSEYVSRRISSRAEALRPYVSFASIETTETPEQGTIVVQGTYEGLLAHLVGALVGDGDGVIPFEISTTVRRAHTAALIVLDRAVGVGAARCGDAHFGRRAAFVTRLVGDLRSFGVDYVQVGVTPGVKEKIDILSSNDEIPRCGGSDDASHLRIASVEGVEGEPIVDSLGVAYRAVQLLFSLAISPMVEQRAIIMVAPSFETRTEAITTTFSLLETEAARQNVKVDAIGIAVGGPDNKDLFGVRSESGRAKYLHVSEDEAGGSDLRIALIHHIQGHTFIAR